MKNLETPKFVKSFYTYAQAEDPKHMTWKPNNNQEVIQDASNPQIGKGKCTTNQNQTQYYQIWNELQ